MTNHENVVAMYGMISSGQMLEAFEKYYDESVVMQEIGEEPRTGKSTNREYEKNFVGSVKEIHGAGIDSITADEKNGITAVENWMDLTFQNGMRVKMEQVAIQRWKDGKIVHEKFYHK